MLTTNMSRKLKAALPDPDILLSLTPSELAAVLLPILKGQQQNLSAYNFINELHQTEEIYPRAKVDQIGGAIMESWWWMIANGLLAPNPRQPSGDWVIITRAGYAIETDEQFNAFRKANSLPKELLHSVVQEKSWPNFIRGDYDTAVFQAFKEVEVAVRKASGADERTIGTELMRVAFHFETGLLSDQNVPKAEREALAHLFAGAIGSYKNPHSHRTVVINDPIEAGEMLILASHLLRIVESRSLFG